MLEFTLYECEVCEKRHEVKTNAEICEKKHVKPNFIMHYCYLEEQEYPEKIEVVMEDGWTKTYYK